jgi:hypothetical protein
VARVAKGVADQHPEVRLVIDQQYVEHLALAIP